MSSSKPKATSQLSQAEREGNARQGYCASAFFAQAKDIPDFVSKVLPDDEFCLVQDLFKGLRRVENQLLKMNPTEGPCFVMMSVKEARRLTLSLVLANTSVGFSDEFDPSPVLRQQHSALKTTLRGLEKLVSEVQQEAPSYEAFREQIEQLPNQSQVSDLLSIIAKDPIDVQTLAGPVGFDSRKIKVRELASEREHVLIGRVVGGYDEQAATVLLEVSELDDADARLFSVRTRIKLQVVQETHRLSLLLAQLAKVPVKIEVNIPRISIFQSSPAKPGLLCDLRRVEVLEQAGSLEAIKQALIHQLKLDV